MGQIVVIEEKERKSTSSPERRVPSILGTVDSLRLQIHHIRPTCYASDVCIFSPSILDDSWLPVHPERAIRRKWERRCHLTGVSPFSVSCSKIYYVSRSDGVGHSSTLPRTLLRSKIHNRATVQSGDITNIASERCQWADVPHRSELIGVRKAPHFITPTWEGSVLIYLFP